MSLNKNNLNSKETFLEWSKRVDINCYTKMINYKGNYFVQFIWILLGSTGATIFLIDKSIMDYLKHDVTTQIKSVSQIPSKFPTITFCDNNPFATLYSEEFMRNISEKNGNISDRSILFELSKMEASSGYFSDEIRQLLGSWLTGAATFKGRDRKNDLHWYWSYEYGNCYQFNSGFNFTNQRIEFVDVTRVENKLGLKMGAFPFINLNSFVTTSEKGGVVFIHNSSFKPTQPVFVVRVK